MRILMINKYLYPKGGSETYMLKLGEYLSSSGHEVQYFGMDSEKRCVGNHKNVYTQNMDFHGGSGIKKLFYPIKTIYSFEAARKLHMVLNDFKPQVVHLNNFNYQLTPSVITEIVKWRSKIGRKCSIVYTAHDYQLICPNHMLRNPETMELCSMCLDGGFLNCTKRRCIHSSLARSIIGMTEAYYWSVRKVYRYIDTVICCSKYMKKKMDLNPIFRGKTIVLHNFVDGSPTVQTSKQDYVLYFGRFTKEKGVETLLKSIKMCPDIPFVFAGEGELEKQVDSISNITNVGFKTGMELEKLICEARFSICPSEWNENCPFSVLESISKGTPVLGASIGGVPELIVSGKTGELFRSGDQDDLKNGIEKMWHDTRLTSKYDSCADVSGFDTIDQYSSRLVRLYKKCGCDKTKNEEKYRKLNGTVIVTYRCNARCTMCNRYKEPSKVEDEISLDTIKKLPDMYFTNITGGEPFLRDDLPDIVRELYKKSDRIVISTNGFFSDRIVALAKEFPDIGIRISIEGLKKTNDEIRGLENGYARGYTTLVKLKKMGLKDIGFGITIQDRNALDLIPLYEISNRLNMEFATASLHNSFYFVESHNIIKDRPMVSKNFELLINRMLESRSPKKWFRAYFNHGLINYIYGQPRLLPCDMSFDTFFIDPYGDVMPCNGTKEKIVMGNLNRQSWDDLWNSERSENVRRHVRRCDRNCWMIGSVSPAMHKYIWIPAWWVIKHKIKGLFGKQAYSMYENKICRLYRDGVVTKEELDACSTCEMASDES